MVGMNLNGLPGWLRFAEVDRVMKNTPAGFKIEF
jgi:hypothetical protein